MLSHLIKLEHVVEGKVCQFMCHPETDIKIVKDALCKFLAYAEQVEEAVKKAREEAEAKAKAESEAPNEEEKVGE